MSVARGGKINWNSQTQNNATPGLPQSEGHPGYKMSHLPCLDDNVTLLVPDAKPQEVVLGSSETKLSTLVSTMREEKCSEKMIEDTHSAFMVLSRLKSTTDPRCNGRVVSLEYCRFEESHVVVEDTAKCR